MSMGVNHIGASWAARRLAKMADDVAEGFARKWLSKLSAKRIGNGSQLNCLRN
jgi:hypothetical protein